MQGGDGDDEDLFADDEEGDAAAAAELKAKAAAAKDKAKADKPPAKTNIVLDVKGACSYLHVHAFIHVFKNIHTHV